MRSVEKLPAALALARMLALDQTADHRDFAECALEQMRLLDPLDELMLEYVGRVSRGSSTGSRL